MVEGQSRQSLKCENMTGVLLVWWLSFCHQKWMIRQHSLHIGNIQPPKVCLHNSKCSYYSNLPSKTFQVIVTMPGPAGLKSSLPTVGSFPDLAGQIFIDSLLPEVLLGNSNIEVS